MQNDSGTGIQNQDSLQAKRPNYMGRGPLLPILCFLAIAGLLLPVAAGAQSVATPTMPATATPEGSQLEAAVDDVAADALSRPSAVAQFTTSIEDREPTDQVTFVSNDVRKIFFYTDLRNLNGQRVIHRWIYKGEIVAEVPFAVAGPRWRVWSSKELLEDWLGDWTVEIVSEDGEVIAAETFSYSATGA